MNELITVIVPVYNVAPYLEKCAQSILNQDYQSIELLLIDDGSSDGSSEICDALAQADPRVGVIHKANGGVSSARNSGMGAADGGFICFVDGDDYCDPDMLSYLKKIMDESGSDVARCGSRAVGEHVPPQTEYDDSEYAAYSPEEALKWIYLAEKGFSATSCHILYRKNILEDVYFGKAKYYEDMDFITKVCLNSKSVVSSRALKYNYLHRADSSHSYSFADRMANIDMVCDSVKVSLEDKMPQLKPYVDIRYVKNALDELNRESLDKGLKGNAEAERVIKKIKSLNVPLSSLNKTEKLLYMSMCFGTGGLGAGTKLVRRLKNH